jgi:hypothetical protein
MVFTNKVIQNAKEFAYQFHKVNNKYTPCPSELLKWIGIDKIFISNKNKLKEIKEKYTIIKGDCDMLKFINDTTISYRDHVSRIVTNNGLLPEAIYTFPNLTNNKPNIFEINKPPKYISKTANETVEKFKNTIITEKPEPFTYENMESGKGLVAPVCLGYPDFLIKLKHIPIRFENVLHLPIKINKECENKFNKEGRTDSLGNKISFDKIYLPKELDVLKDYVQYLAQIERRSNPYFNLHSYMFLSISDSEVLPNDTHRRGGWHIDGHQGYERLMTSTTKHLTDRQYILCDTLPTEFYPMKFNFSELRKNHILDSINIQAQIDLLTSKQELKFPEKIQTIKPNEINFLTPYMVHRGQTNKTNKPIKRKFVRVICSTYSRDRIGDTVNPIFGPLNPMKIKTVTDIYEV